MIGRDGASLRKIRRTIGAFLPLALAFWPTPAAAARASGVALDPKAHGSSPARLLSSGEICLIDASNPERCAKPLMMIPRAVRDASSATFYGVFDLDRDGTPEIVFDTWEAEDAAVAFHVYKVVDGAYREFLNLKAPSAGYAPDGWFLDDASAPAAILQTRYGGSSGNALFLLDLRRRSLELITPSMFVEGPPVFVDLDDDGVAEIVVSGRGRDRTSPIGAAVLARRGTTYTRIWPDWDGAPYAIYARVVALEGGRRKAVVAVLEPTPFDDESGARGKTAAGRELAAWTLEAGALRESGRTRLPDARHVSEPVFEDAAAAGAVRVRYMTAPRTLRCEIREKGIDCGEVSEASGGTTAAR